MNHDVTQWLAEIKALKQQIAEVERQREEAYASADRWRDLYNTEAQQRRNEVKRNQETIAELHLEIQRLQERFHAAQSQQGQVLEAIAQEAAQQGEQALKAKLLETLNERDRARTEIERLTTALETEKASHEQTRKTLTMALGDTVDLLSKGRSSTPTKGAFPMDDFDDLSLDLSPVNPPKPAQAFPELFSLETPELDLPEDELDLPKNPSPEPPPPTPEPPPA